MAQYHVTADGPRACKATVKDCPYAKEGEPHFDNIDSANSYYGEIMEEKHGLTATVTSDQFKDSHLYKIYKNMEKLSATSAEAKKITRISNYRNDGSRRIAAMGKDFSKKSKLRNRMASAGYSNQISKMAVKDGVELFKSVGQTPKNVIKFHGYLTRELENQAKI